MATYWGQASGPVLLDTSEDLSGSNTYTHTHSWTELALCTQILALGLIIIDHNGIMLSSAALMDADGLRHGKHLVTFLIRHTLMTEPLWTSEAQTRNSS